MVDEELRKKEDTDQFLYSVTHDLRSPLTAIKGMSELLFEEYAHELGKDGTFYLNRIIENTDRMDSMINDLLKLYSVGRTKYQLEKVNAYAVINEITQKYLKLYGLDNSHIDINKSIPMIVYDRESFYQIFNILVDNSFKFMGDQTNPHISIWTKRCNGLIEFHVKDNGIGINSKNTKKIFKVFERLSDVYSKGNGVGLTLAKKIIEYNEGNIWVESIKDEGSTFIFTIPYKEEQKNGI